MPKARLAHAKFYYIGSVFYLPCAHVKMAAVNIAFDFAPAGLVPLGRLAATEERPAGKQALFLLAEKIPFLFWPSPPS